MTHLDTMTSSSSERTHLHRKSPTSERSRSIFLSPVYSPTSGLRLSLPSLDTPSSWTLHAHNSISTDLGQSSQSQATSGYLSPPYTDPRLQDNIPLPVVNPLDLNCYPIRTHFFGGLLDSPPVMYHEALKRLAPLSPPATLPTSTSSLPHAEIDPLQFSPLDDVPGLLNLGEDSDSGSPLLDALTPSSEGSNSTLLSPLSPTSPESPEWHQDSFLPIAIRTSASTPSSVLLRNNSVDTSPTSSIDCDDSYLDKQEHMSSKRPLLSPLNISHPYEFWPLCHSPKDIHQPPDLEPIDFENTQFSPPLTHLHSLKPDNTADQDQEITQALTDDGNSYEAHQYQQHQQHQQEDIHLQALTYPQGNFPHPSSPSIRNNSLPEFDDDPYDMEIDSFKSSVLEDPPASPSLRSYTALPDDDHSPDSSQPPYPNSDEDTPMLSPPASPSLTLLALPGAETDDDLIPLDLASTRPSTPDHIRLFPTHGRSTSTPYPNPLLIVDDDSQTLSHQNQRSPSPEPCTLLDTSLVMHEFPEDDELRRICSLLKRTRDAERAARQMEGIVEEEERIRESIAGEHNSSGSLEPWGRLMDARKKTRRRKEKVRELATLLRLKLAQRGWKAGKAESGKMGLIPITTHAPTSVLSEGAIEDGVKPDIQQQQRAKGVQKKQRITSPQQLLVKMIMDRHEPRTSSRATAPAFLAGRKAMSPLARGSFSTNEIEAELGDVDTDMQEAQVTPPQAPILEVEMRDERNESSDLDSLSLDVDLSPFPLSP